MNSRSERVKPNYGTRYYIPSITNGFLSELHYWGDEPQFDEIVFNRGLVFLDERDAITTAQITLNELVGRGEIGEAV